MTQVMSDIGIRMVATLSQYRLHIRGSTEHWSTLKSRSLQISKLWALMRIGIVRAYWAALK